jgi:uncharacterized protein
MNQETIYDFQWDPAKALYNARKHDVTFDQAATVFLDALALVAHTYEDAGAANIRVRIISARKATKSERRAYEDEPR